VVGLGVAKSGETVRQPGRAFDAGKRKLRNSCFFSARNESDWEKDGFGSGEAARDYGGGGSDKRKSRCKSSSST